MELHTNFDTVWHDLTDLLFKKFFENYKYTVSGTILNLENSSGKTLTKFEITGNSVQEANFNVRKVSGTTIQVTDVCSDPGNIKNLIQYGQCIQIGIPSQDTPVSITGKTAGITATQTVTDSEGNNVVLYGVRVESGGNIVIDGQPYIADTISGNVVTRRIEKLILDGTNCTPYHASSNAANGYSFAALPVQSFGRQIPYSTHFHGRNIEASANNIYCPNDSGLMLFNSNSNMAYPLQWITWFTEQYEAGTPVTIYYALPEANWTTEVVTVTPESLTANSPTTTLVSDAYSEAEFKVTGAGNIALPTPTWQIPIVNVGTGTIIVKVTTNAGSPIQEESFTLLLDEPLIQGNTLNIVNGKLIKRRSCVDLGTRTWEKQSTGSSYLFAAGMNPRMKSGLRQDGLCSAYSKNSTYSASEQPDKTFTNGYSDEGVYIRDDRYTDAATFKAAMSGVMLEYELADPIEIDISGQNIPTFEGTTIIEVISDPIPDSMSATYWRKD